MTTVYSLLKGKLVGASINAQKDVRNFRWMETSYCCRETWGIQLSRLEASGWTHGDRFPSNSNVVTCELRLRFQWDAGMAFESSFCSREILASLGPAVAEFIMFAVRGLPRINYSLCACTLELGETRTLSPWKTSKFEIELFPLQKTGRYG